MKLRSFLFEKLSRVTTGGKFIPELDGLRFIAIVLVILHHFIFYIRENYNVNTDSIEGLIGAIIYVGNAGGIGVPLFFILSGFILGLPFAECRFSGRQPVRLKKYFLRRLSRLEPPYIINLTILLCLSIASNGLTAGIEKLPNYLASVLYVHNTVYNEWSAINFVAWSLEVEAQFYIIAPALALTFLIKGNASRYFLFSFIVMLCIYLSGVTIGEEYWLAKLVFNYLHYFLIGYILADLYANKRLSPMPSRSVLWDLIGTLFFCASIYIWNTEVFSGHLVKQFSSITLGIFVLCVFKGESIKKFLSCPVVYLYGGMCYTVYLYHFWIMKAAFIPLEGVKIDWLGIDFFLVLVYLFVITAFVSSILFYLFERPFMYRDWPKKVASIFKSAR